MSGKSLDDYTDAERSAYEQGAVDTHARYEAMQTQASEWLTAVLGVIGAVEAHRGGWSASMVVGQLREALSLDPTVTITCPCTEHTSKEEKS